MFNKLPSSKSESSFPVILIPIIVALYNNDKIKSILSFDQNFSEKSYMLKDIKPYFSVKEQYILSKLEDVLDIFGKIGRIQKETYEDELSTTAQSIPKKERKEQILKSMATHLDDKNKDLIQKIIDTNQKIEETRDNLDYHNNKNQSTQNESNITNIVKLINCFRPLFKDIDNKKIKKLDKIIEILNIPEERF